MALAGFKLFGTPESNQGRQGIHYVLNHPIALAWIQTRDLLVLSLPLYHLHYLFIYLFIWRESKRTFECQMA